MQASPRPTRYGWTKLCSDSQRKLDALVEAHGRESTAAKLSVGTAIVDKLAYGGGATALAVARVEGALWRMTGRIDQCR